MAIEHINTVNNNDIVRKFYQDGDVFPLSGASKIEIQIFAGKDDPVERTAHVLSRNTVDDAALFDVTDLADATITFKPGTTETALLPNTEPYYGRYIVFAPDKADGKVWDIDLFEISVRL